MRFLGITEIVQKMNFLRSCAGAELTKFWEKEVRVLFEVTREGKVDVPAHTYEKVVENTKQTLLKQPARYPVPHHYQERSATHLRKLEAEGVVEKVTRWSQSNAS